MIFLAFNLMKLNCLLSLVVGGAIAYWLPGFLYNGKGPSAGVAGLLLGFVILVITVIVAGVFFYFI
jgi:hypothetical protein